MEKDLGIVVPKNFKPSKQCNNSNESRFDDNANLSESRLSVSKNFALLIS